MAKLSNVAGVGIAQEIAEPLINISTSTTSDLTSFSRSDEGVAIVAINSPDAIIAKRVQSEYLPTNQESYTLLVSPGNNAWIDAQARFPFITSATAKYGMRITVVSSVQVDVEFGGDGPSAGETWSSYTSWKWKLLKHRDGGTINTGAAHTTRSGLVNTQEQSFSGDKSFVGNVHVHGTGRGIVPVGAIIAIADSAAWSLPGAGAVKDGYALCNGQAFPAESNAAFSGNMPNLSDERFLQGSTSSGTVGGANTVTLVTANLPAHSHSINHDHASFTITGGSHSHGISDPGHAHNHGVDTTQGYAVGTPISATSGAGGFDAGEFSDRAPNLWASGFIRAGSTGISVQTNSSHSHTVDVPNFTGTSGNTGSATAFDIRPKYFNVVYVMRVL